MVPSRVVGTTDSTRTSAVQDVTGGDSGALQSVETSCQTNRLSASSGTKEPSRAKARPGSARN